MSGQGRNGRYYQLSGLSVMVADDNRFVRTLLVNVLHGLGLRRILQAESGEEALAQLEASFIYQGSGGEVDILFCDHLMEPMNGLDLLSAIRRHEHEKLMFLPVVMMSGEADEKAVFSARDRGVTEYLAKPLSVNNVVSRLLAIIDRPRPFIRAPEYFGPDRRRQTLGFEGDDRRVMVVQPVVLGEDGLPVPASAAPDGGGPQVPPEDAPAGDVETRGALSDEH